MLGIALGIAPSAAFVALTGYFTPAILMLSLSVFLWSSSFDILYSLSDEEIDREEGLHSVPQTVSYTHLDVYKRQAHRRGSSIRPFPGVVD